MNKEQALDKTTASEDSAEVVQNEVVKDETVQKKTAQNKESNEEVTTELNFEMLRQYAWLSSATIGGLIVLLQLNALKAELDVFVTMGFFAASIFTAIVGQDYMADSLLKGKNVYDIAPALNKFRFGAMMCFSIGVGYLFAHLFLF